MLDDPNHEPDARPREVQVAPATPPATDLSTYTPGVLDLFSDDAFDEPAPPTPWYRRTGLIATVVVVLIAALIVGALAVLRNRPQPINYTYATARTGNLAVTVSATGPLQAAVYGANFAVSGHLAEIDVAIGQSVTAGQQLAKLDPTQLQDALNQAQDAANQAYDNEQNAFFTCDQEAAQNKEPPNCKQAAIDAYNAALAQLQTAKDNLAAATLYAPHAGIVSAVNGNVGGSPGSSSAGSTSNGTAVAGFIIIQDTSVLQVVATVNEADIANLVVGQHATFTVSAYSNRQFAGKVSQISPFGQTTANVVTFPVTIDVDMTSLNNAKLFPGMTAQLTIIRAQRSGVVLIPATAITFARTAVVSSRGSSGSSGGSSTALVTASQLRDVATQARQMLSEYEQANKNYADDTPTAAFVLESTGTAPHLTWTAKAVVIGLTDGTNYEVLAGLSAGERVAVGSSTGSATSTVTTGGNGRGGGIFGGGGGGGNGGGRGGNGG